LRRRVHHRGVILILLSNGRIIDYVTASGALAFDGSGWPHTRYLLGPLKFHDSSLFTVTLKTLTREPRRGNGYTKVLPLNQHGAVLSFWDFLFSPNKIAGFVNSVGLKNPGIDRATGKYPRMIKKSGLKVIGSLYADDLNDLVYMANKFNDWPLVALELNASCPNIPQRSREENSAFIIESARILAESSNHPLILKLSFDDDYLFIAKTLAKDNFIEAISMNSIKYSTVFPGLDSPFSHIGGGGVSGKLSRDYYYIMAKNIMNETDISLILPVWSEECIENWLLLSTINDHDISLSFGSVFIRWPWWPTAFIKRNGKDL